MRVHELAKKMGMASKQLIDELRSLKVEVKNHMSVLDPGIAEIVEHELKSRQSAAQEKAPQINVAPSEAPQEQAAEAEPSLTQTTTLEVEETPKGPRPIQISMPITVGNLAQALGLKIADLIKGLMEMGIFANINQPLSEPVVYKVADKFEKVIEKLPEEEVLRGTAEDEDPKNLKLRPPVVTLMGHVDHGKTTLLDTIRSSKLAEQEAGRITQHIGAYGVDVLGKGHVTFLDTPGHEAFTAMRTRGANVTDIVVLVVAADDGIMPQTIEAIDHARAAGVPIVVAINKIDLPSANPNRVKAELQKIDLTPEEWGGKTITVEVSAKEKKGIDQLLEMLLLQAEVLELKANPARFARGTVLEGKLTKSHGPVAAVLVQDGMLKIGDNIVSGPHYGRVRAMHNDRGKPVREAGPSYAVEIQGLDGVSEAGEHFLVVDEETKARKLAERKALELREKSLSGTMRKHVTLSGLYDRIKEGQIKELRLIVKGDAGGSVEALTQSLEKLSTEQISLRILHGAPGGINESDIMLAAASDAIIIGFHVKADTKAEMLMEKEGVEVRYYKIIYEAVEDVKKALEGLLEPTLKEVVEGRVEIRQVFTSSRVGTIGGAFILKGKIARTHRVRLIRDQIVIFEGSLASLKRFKDDVKEVPERFECGVALQGFNDIRVGDFLEAYRLEKVATKLV